MARKRKATVPTEPKTPETAPAVIEAVDAPAPAGLADETPGESLPEQPEAVVSGNCDVVDLPTNKPVIAGGPVMVTTQPLRMEPAPDKNSAIEIASEHAEDMEFLHAHMQAGFERLDAEEQEQPEDFEDNQSEAEALEAREWAERLLERDAEIQEALRPSDAPLSGWVERLVDAIKRQVAGDDVTSELEGLASIATFDSQQEALRVSAGYQARGLLQLSNPLNQYLVSLPKMAPSRVNGSEVPDAVWYLITHMRMIARGIAVGRIQPHLAIHGDDAQYEVTHDGTAYGLVVITDTQHQNQEAQVKNAREQAEQRRYSHEVMLQNAKDREQTHRDNLAREQARAERMGEDYPPYRVEDYNRRIAEEQANQKRIAPLVQHWEDELASLDAQIKALPARRCWVCRVEGPLVIEAVGPDWRPEAV